jgi:hypothetical protein
MVLHTKALSAIRMMFKYHLPQLVLLNMLLACNCIQSLYDNHVSAIAALGEKSTGCCIVFEGRDNLEFLSEYALH